MMSALVVYSIPDHRFAVVDLGGGGRAGKGGTIESPFLAASINSSVADLFGGSRDAKEPQGINYEAFVVV